MAATASGACYANNVVGSGANYDDAYFEIRYLRAYTTEAPGVAPTAVVGALKHDASSAEMMRVAPSALWGAAAWGVVMGLCGLAGGLAVL